MANVKTDSTTGSKKAASKPAVKKPNPVLPFVVNLLQGNIIKPTQGKTIRWLTAGGIGLILGTGVLKLYEVAFSEGAPFIRFGVPFALLALAGWFAFRVVQFAPFTDFLIATEAEMNKVSWTSKKDLYRATIVVLSTVTILALYLFFVDKLWVFLLELIGVLRIRSGDFGSQAG
jgi:preprotein translocase subunit SecE